MTTDPSGSMQPSQPSGAPVFAAAIDPLTVQEAEPSSSLVQRAMFVAVASVAGVVLGVVGGYLWSVVADPPAGVLTERGVFFTDELSYNQQVVVMLWFLVIGAGLGLLAGLVVGLLGRRHGMATVIAVLVLTGIACAVSAWLGIEVFGPDPQAEVDAAEVGDSITAALEISSNVFYLGWPIGGLIGLLVAVSTWSRAKAPKTAWLSSNVTPH